MTRLTGRLGRSGSALIEFALLAPILITLLLSVADVAPTLMMRFKFGTATQAVADLATQSSTMTTGDVANDFAIGSDVMVPFSGATLVLRITNVASDGNGNAFVYWSCGQGVLPPPQARTAVTSIPAGLISLGKSGLNTSYVMVESQYTYTAPAKFIFRNPQVTKMISYTLPRVSTYIGPTTGDPSYVPPAPASTHYNYTTTVNGVTCNVAI